MDVVKNMLSEINCEKCGDYIEDDNCKCKQCGHKHKNQHRHRYRGGF